MPKRVLSAVAVCLLCCALAAGCFLFQNQPPVAVATVLYNVDPADLMVVDLDASASTDPDNDSITSFLWAFSDDLAVIEPLAYSTTVSYPRLRIRCPNEGQYTATLLVRDARGLSSEPSAPIAITVPQPLP